MRAGKREREVAKSILNVTCESPLSREEQGRLGDSNFLLFKVSETAATLYGKEHEKDALEQLASVCDITITAARKVVPRLNKWLVCIPDGLVEAGEGEEAAIVEVKCPG